jgi:ubiquinone/menaquinone biosynthesis C-methylase UbiE
VRGKRVLDIAVGSGLGLDVLEAAGACTIGMDYDLEPLVQSHKPRLAQADAATLPLPDASIELITSFETLEHVPDAAAMVTELRRVLRPSGSLVLSTPNKAFRESSNPFHIQEFTTDELRQLLRAHFEQVTIYGQWPREQYRFVPFLMHEPHWTADELAWKALNRLPLSVKEYVAQLLSGSSFYPSEHDYLFEPERFDGAHALLAVAS